MQLNILTALLKLDSIPLARVALCSLLGLSSLGQAMSDPEGESIDRNLAVEDIDPAVYFKTADPSDPFHDVYAGFRQRRADDMADASKPPPIEAFSSAHITRNMPWNRLEDVLPFDWAAIRRESPLATEQLERSVKARLAFDHPDIKITQLLLGVGATLPSHAGGSPGFYHVIGGTGVITIEDESRAVTPGSTVKINPFDVRRLQTTSAEPLKVLWVRWAPGGDQQYIAAGYYLTGANQHIQPKVARLATDFKYWGETPLRADTQSLPAALSIALNSGSVYQAQLDQLSSQRAQLEGQRDLYPQTPTFSHESDSAWINEEMLAGSGFFWAKDISQLGGLLARWDEVMKLKGFFRAQRADGGWDFNISQMVWGAHARYVEHSHSIPEFYYMMSGPVEHWVGETKYRAMPGDIFMTNSYETHQSRGIVDDLPFRNIGASWAPNGDRSVFSRPFYLLETLPVQPASADLGDAPKFH